MNGTIRRVLPFAVIALLLGCAQQPTLSPRTPMIACVGKCEVDVVVDDWDCNKSYVKVDEVRFPRMAGERPNQNVQVTWVLPRDKPYGFCPGSAQDDEDGVFLKRIDPYAQFQPDGTDDGQGAGRCNRKKLKLIARNTKELQRYPYALTFHSSDGTKSCRTVDPAMINE
jgi:hypothetical protein